MTDAAADRYEGSVAILLGRIATETGAISVRLLQRTEQNSGWVETASVGSPAGRPGAGPDHPHLARRRHSDTQERPSRSTLLRIDSPTGRTIALVSILTPEPLTADRIATVHGSWDLLTFTVDAMARLQEMRTTLADTDRRRRQGLESAAIDDRLSECARGGGGLAALVQTCARLTDKSVTLFDTHGRTVTFCHAAVSHTAVSSVRTPPLDDILAACPDRVDDDSVYIAVADRTSGLARRKMVVSVTNADELFGYLVVDEHPTAFTAVDERTASRTAHLLGYEYSVQKRVARVAWNARSSLTRQLVRGTIESADLAASGEYLGVDIGARRVVVYILDRSPAATEIGADQQLATLIERELGVEVLATRGADALMLLVEAPEYAGALTMVAKVKAAMAVATDARSGSAIVGISSVCTPRTLARGYREAREVALCIDRFAQLPDNRVLAVDDLGPARLFLANSDVAAVRSYVDDVLGTLLTGSTGTDDLLLTLAHYFDRGRSVRGAAATLGLHENTIRLRLARVHTLTGLDVAADANDQLSAQTALLLLRLRGGVPMAHPIAHHGRKFA